MRLRALAILAMVALLGCVLVSVRILGDLPSNDDENVAIQFGVMILLFAWWAYCIAGIAISWLCAWKLGWSSIWLLMLPCIAALWFTSEAKPFGLSDWMGNFFEATLILSLPSVLGIVLGIRGSSILRQSPNPNPFPRAAEN